MANDKTNACKPDDQAFSKDPLKDKIGASLKSMYDEIVNEPVPDDFLNLLAKADASRAQETSK